MTELRRYGTDGTGMIGDDVNTVWERHGEGAATAGHLEGLGPQSTRHVRLLHRALEVIPLAEQQRHLVERRAARVDAQQESAKGLVVGAADFQVGTAVTNLSRRLQCNGWNGGRE